MRSIIVSVLVIFLTSHVYSEDPQITNQVGDYDKPLDLVCTIDGIDATKPVTWKKDRDEVAPTNELYEIIAANQTLRIKKIAPAAMGVFQCKQDEKEMTFNIRVRPYVEAFDPSRNVIQGDPLRLECKAWGIPTPQITWYRNEVQLVQKEDGVVTLKPYGGQKGDKFPEIANGTIRIATLDYPDRGNYSCQVEAKIHENQEPIIVTATVLVEIKDKYAALWPFLGICVEVAVLCTVILIYEKRRAKRIEEEERQEEAAHLNANNEARPAAGGEEVRQRK